ncbi:hypothetical protein [Candidatus Ponderosibacter sp. Uisw_141_02]|uniref:hypothetical protein n=1 Tax=Candidatus Ponderosibacter sp. Uisw_141_02 TaxID=3231000 RepID=UPI003D4E2113
MSKDFFFVGNSQLITSILAQYCNRQERQQIGKAWTENKDFYKGVFEFDGSINNFIACNMGLLGRPILDFKSQKIAANEGMFRLVEMIEDGKDTIVVMLRGNEFAEFCLIDNPPKFDFSTILSPATKGRQFVHSIDLAVYIKALTNPILATSVMIKNKYPKREVVYVMPPPFPCDSHLLKQHEFANLIRDYGLKPTQIRQKLYQMISEILSADLKKLGINCLAAPSESLKEIGVLKKEYAHGAIHGNEKFGAALMKSLHAHFGTN